MTIQALLHRRAQPHMLRLSTVLVTCAVAGAVVTLAGCGHDPSSSSSTARAPRPAPTDAGDCNDLGTQRGDGFVLAGTDWSNDVHAYHEPAVVYVCVQPGTGGRVSLETSGRGISITPRSRATSSSETGVLAFRVRVRVRQGATGTLTMRQESPGATSGGPGPTVVAETDGWHFASAECEAVARIVPRTTSDHHRDGGVGLAQHRQLAGLGGSAGERLAERIAGGGWLGSETRAERDPGGDRYYNSRPRGSAR